MLCALKPVDGCKEFRLKLDSDPGLLDQQVVAQPTKLPGLFSSIWRKSHRSQITLSAEGISYNIARQVKLTPDAFGSLRHVRRIL